MSADQNTDPAAALPRIETMADLEKLGPVGSLLWRLRAPAYWMSGSCEGPEGENDAPREAADLIEAQAARIRELEAALRRAREYGISSRAWDARMGLDLIDWIDAGMNRPLPALPSWLVEFHPEQVASLSALPPLSETEKEIS